MYWTAVKVLVALGVWRRLTKRKPDNGAKQQAIDREVDRGAMLRLWIEHKQNPDGPPLVAISWCNDRFNVLGRFKTDEDARRFVPDDVTHPRGPRYWIFHISRSPDSEALPPAP